MLCWIQSNVMTWMYTYYDWNWNIAKWIIFWKAIFKIFCMQWNIIAVVLWMTVIINIDNKLNYFVIHVNWQFIVGIIIHVNVVQTWMKRIINIAIEFVNIVLFGILLENKIDWTKQKQKQKQSIMKRKKKKWKSRKQGKRASIWIIVW